MLAPIAPTVTLEAAKATAATPSNPPASPNTTAATTAPSGSWTIVPGLLNVTWSYKPDNDEVDVSVDVLWWSLDKISGTLNKDQLSLSDRISILDVITRSFGTEIVFDQVAGGDAPGLWINGDLDVFGKDWKLKAHILSW